MHYYNEFDPQAAQWLRSLIASGHLPQGDVDESSILDVSAEEIGGYTQHHFFAGIGGWPLALKMAGWPEDRPIVTGSPPCQPFSQAGQQRGLADERHLWPHFFQLLRALRPPVVMGEQVASAVGKGWLDGVRSDMEGEGYAFRAVIIPACAVNAPHRRDRLWFVARPVGDREHAGLEGHTGDERPAQGRQEPDRPVAQAGVRNNVADTGSQRRQQIPRCPHGHEEKDEGGSEKLRNLSSSDGEDNSWARSVGLTCFDGKVRRIPEAQSGLPLLVDGVSPFVAGMLASAKTASIPVALKGFGNAIVPQVAEQIIRSYMETS